MRLQITCFFILVLFVFSMPRSSHAAITSFPWSTTFNCAEWAQNNSVSCDGLENDGSWFTSSGSKDAITSGANNPNGAGGRGFRHWRGDGDNNNGGGLKVTFPSAQKELWVRWYERWQSGYNWASLGYAKELYFTTAGPNISVIPEFNGTNYALIAEGTPNYYQVVSNYGWNSVMGGNTGDGQFHSFEIHMKMDTNGSNGIGQIWTDGILKVSNTAVNWSNNNSSAQNGWTFFELGSNQNQPSNGVDMYEDFDDMTIYNTTPPNRDAQGNAFIGPISGASSTPPTVNGACGSASGQSFASLTSASSNLCSTGTVASFSGSGPWTWGCNGSGGGTSTSSTSCTASLTSTPTTPAPTANLLFSESFENNSYASRGWYDNTNHGTIVAGGQSGNCLQWAWASGATTPTNGGSMRMQFTPTESLYLSYYVKFQTGWRGSQKTYHPHMLYVLSDLDNTANAYSPLANNYLQTYVEFLSDVGSPYTIRPQLAIQDEKRVNTSNGTPPNNLAAVTENRSVAYCNTPSPVGAFGTCYADNPYYSANTWLASNASVSTNTWHHVEAYFKMNSISGGKGQSDGIMQEWIDGIQVINQSNVLYRTNQDATKKWAQFVLAPYIGDGSPIAQSMWLDELTLGTSLPSGASVVAPTGLKIKSVTP